jgi:hypothetical protein
MKKWIKAIQTVTASIYAIIIVVSMIVAATGLTVGAAIWSIQWILRLTGVMV